MWFPPGTLYHYRFWPRSPRQGLGVVSGHLCDICFLPLFLFAADNITKIFSLLRNYEPHGPLVRSHQEGESEK